MKKRLIFALILVLLTSIMLACTPPASEQITLQATTPWPQAAVYNVKFFEWIDKVNAEGAGKVYIEYVGGPESVPQAEQVPLLQKGTLDICLMSGDYYENVIPAVDAFNFSRLNPEEEREVGFYGLMAKIHEEQGLVYLGRMAAVAPVSLLWSSFPATKPSDFAGKKIRSAKLSDPIAQELDAVLVPVTESEIYTAMEQHTIDGFVQPLVGTYEQGFHEVAPYIVNHPWNQLSVVILVNKDVWDGLPKDVQDLLMETALEVEATVGDYFMAEHNRQYNLLEEIGVTFTEFSPEDADWFLDTANRLNWETLIEKDPVNGPTLKELAGK